MIVKPTVKELLEHAENRYALVIATSRRARQISNENRGKRMAKKDDSSSVTMAANEIVEGKLRIVQPCEQNAENETNETNENI